jgi:hypothetical protein
MNKGCKVAECGREAEINVPITNRDGSIGEMAVCKPCYNAYQIGSTDPNT